jgi:NitT/TauT family transport system permease protein
MMLTMVEGIVRSEGGIGKLLLDERKHFSYEKVFAINIVMLVLGLAQDYIIGFIRNIVSPYANLSLERR